MTSILAIDPSTTSLGWACNGPVSVTIGTCTARGDRPERLRHMAAQLKHLMETVEPDAVVYYRPFARGDDATRCGWGIAGIIEAAAAQAKAAVIDLPEVTVRRFHGLNGKDRDALKAQALDLAAEIIGLRPRNDDEADAILLLAYARQHITVRSAA